MKIVDKVHQAIGFTPNEIRVIVFLVLAFAAGGAIKMFKVSAHQEPIFDYTSSDSEFAARSKLLASAETDSAFRRTDTVRSWNRSFVHPSKAHGVHLTPHSINLNSASKSEFMKLPGIGEATAGEILQYRHDHGPFGTIDGLLGVKGIGKKKLERIAPFLTLGK